jgi:hypothetical protein
MATQTQWGKLSGTVEAPQLPVTVWNDDFTDLDEEAAVAAAQAAAPASVFSFPQYSDPSIEQLNNHAWLIGVPYKPRNLSTPQAPPVGEVTIDYRMNFVAQPKYVYEALDCIGVYDTDGLVAGFERLKVNVQKVGGVNRVVGLQANPLPEVHTIDYTVPNAAVDAAYRNVVARLAGKFNNSSFMGYGAGEVQLVRFGAAKRTDEDWQFSFGFGAQEVRTNVKFDGVDANGDYAEITVPTILPDSIAWSVDMDVLNPVSNITEKLAEFVVVQRVWELDDFDDLGLGL